MGSELVNPGAPPFRSGVIRVKQNKSSISPQLPLLTIPYTKMLRRQSSLLGLVALLVLLVVVSIPSQSCASPDVVSQKVKRSTFFFAANKENVNKDETVNTSVDVDADSEGSSDESSETEFEIKSIVEPMSEGPYVARLMHPSFPRYSIRVAEPKVCDENVRQVC